MTKKILVPLAPGVEDMEAITIIDIMVRAGYSVIVASADSDGYLTMKASRGVTLTADYRLIDVADDEFDAVVLPGGVEGAENFRDSTLLLEVVKQQSFDGKLVAAICASPALVLQHHNLYPQALMTCHPSFQDRIPEALWRQKQRCPAVKRASSRTGCMHLLKRRSGIGLIMPCMNMLAKYCHQA